MDVILVRYAEVGLKSRTVRSRFERILMDNMMSMMAHNGLEALINCDQGRLFVETNDVPKGCAVLQRVFGIASVSPALKVSSEMQSMRDAAAAYSRTFMPEGASFKVEARRQGTHTYTSMQAAALVGEAILEANADRKVRVDLHKPDHIVYVEIRGPLAYIFADYLDGPAGLPMSSQGKVLAVLREEKDTVAAWLIMKRGCKVVALAKPDSVPAQILRAWDPDIKVVDNEDLSFMIMRHKAAAVVYGYGIKDMDIIKKVHLEVPAFYPLVGMGQDEIDRRLNAIRS
ncbi:MAG TPA: THUMP domain-containing protein [Methanomassiliicoccales archaeon]|nr:THUMP domain-containing protein [Methanomassiliicoccales archaeon]